MIQTRNKQYDALRSIGLIMIILAHVDAVDIVEQIRCFDVPLMLFVSGLSFGRKSFNNNVSEVKGYLIKRTKRLVLPVYLFLFFYFIIHYIISQLGCLNIETHSIKEMIGSFLLLDTPSIGYVWIIRVQLLIALFTPVIAIVINRLLRRHGGGYFAHSFSYIITFIHS